MYFHSIFKLFSILRGQKHSYCCHYFDVNLLIQNTVVSSCISNCNYKEIFFFFSIDEVNRVL